MNGITYTQVAQYIVLIIAYTIPAVFISLQLTGNPIPQLGLFSTHVDSGMQLLARLDQILVDLGFNDYTGLHDLTLNMTMLDRKRVEWGKSVSVRVALGGRRNIKHNTI